MDSKKPQYVNIPAKGLKYVGPKDESLESSKSQYEKDLQAATHSGYGIVGDATTKSDYILEDGLAKYVGTKYPPDHFIPKIESFHEFAKTQMRWEGRVRYIRKHLVECVRREGVNHMKYCRPLAERLIDEIKAKPRWTGQK
ncbi:hypothetical protein AAMO2058_000784700 [Amorphochlora amoebiformis]